MNGHAPFADTPARRRVREAVEAARARANTVRPAPFATMELTEDELNLVIVALDVYAADCQRRGRQFAENGADDGTADRYFDTGLDASLLGIRVRGLGPKRVTRYGRLGAWES